MDVWKYEIISRYLFVQPSPGQYNHLQSISGINKFRALLSWTCSVCTFSLSSFPGCMFLLVDLQLLLDCQKKVMVRWSFSTFGCSRYTGSCFLHGFMNKLQYRILYISLFFAERLLYFFTIYARAQKA